MKTATREDVLWILAGLCILLSAIAVLFMFAVELH